MKAEAIKLGPWRVNSLAFWRFNAWYTTACAIFAVPVVGYTVAQTEEHVKGFSLPPYLVVELCLVAGVGMPALAVYMWRVYRRLADAPKGIVSARCLTRLAVIVAGPKRAALSAEWAGHLAGETGAGLPSRRQARDALGFVASAIQCRLADAVDAAWTPIDAILKSRKLSNLLVFGPTATAAMYILRHLGMLGALASVESISGIGGALYGLVRVGRWWRDVKPPEPKARRVKE